MEKLGIDENTPIESKMLTNSLEKAQERVEGRNFDSRKHVLEYDDVLNKHRNTIYKHRRAILKNEIKPDDEILKLVEEEVERVTLFHTGTQVDLPSAFQSEPKPDRDPKEIVEVLNTIFPASEDLAKKIETEIKELSMDKEELARQRSFVIEGFVAEAKVRMLKAKEAIEKPEQLEQAHRTLMLRASDNMWVRHLDEMRYLRRSIGLRGYGQRDPLLEYKKESFHMFESLQHNISREIVYNVYKMLDQAVAAQAVMQMAPSIIERAKIQFQGAKKTMGDDKKGQTFRRPASGRALAATLAAGVASASANASSDDKVGRNKPCPCGSGKKFKKCHGA